MSPAECPTSGPRGVLFSRLTRRQEVFLLLLVAVAVRLWDCNAPYIDGHWIKQLQVAPIAKNFYLRGYRLLWPQTDYTPDLSRNYIEIEFQLVTFLTALLYPLFGVREWVGRLVTVAFSLGTMWLLWLLLRRHLGERPATWGLLFFAFAPSSWYYSRALMSEPAMLFFSVATVYCFSRWLGSTRPQGCPSAGIGWFLVTALCGALAFLVKLPTVLLVIPLAYLAWTRWGARFWLRPALWLLLLLSLGPALAYYWHAKHNIGEHYFTVGVGLAGGMWFSLKDFLRPGNYSLMLNRLLKDHLTAVGMVLLVIGLFLPRRAASPATPLLAGEGSQALPQPARDETPPLQNGTGQTRGLAEEPQAGGPALPAAPYLFHVWLGAVLLYFVLVSGGNLRQTYYQLPLLLPVAGLVGLAWERLVQTRAVSRAGNAVLVALFLTLCVWGVQPFYEPFTPILRASAALDQLDPSGQPVIIFPPGYGCLYYFHRPGWVGRESFGKPLAQVPPEDLPGPAYVESRIARGARWAVYFAASGPGARPDLETYLRTTYRRVILGEGFEIFDLREPAEQPPPCPIPPPEKAAI